MPYRVGEKGSYGCSGYPVLKEDDNTVMGCHATVVEAQNQITAINMSEAEKGKKRIPSGVEGFEPASSSASVLDREGYEAEKEVVTSGGGVGIKNPQAWPGTEIEHRKPKLVHKNKITEGSYVMGMTIEGIAHGRVEHIMWEGGVLGEGEYALESKPPQNPAMSVRVYEQEDEGYWVPTAYSIGMMYEDATVLEDLEDHTMPENMQDEMLELMQKSETYSPNDGMKAAARRALKWKEEGKAKGAGTPVGWGRATDIVAGRSMSLSVVKRMFSFFSRHEKASKGAQGFRSGEEGYPSNGRIMWDAWGGDAGFSWSRAIVERNRDKALFSDFGKDYTRSTGVDWFKAKSISVGDHVLFAVPKDPQPTEYAHGEVERVERSGTVTIGNESVEASSDNPVAVVRVWAKKEGGGYTKTDRRVAKPFSSLRTSSEDLKEAADTDVDLEKVSAKVESRLKELAEKYNKNKEGNKRITVGALKAVYRRGIGAYRTNPGSVRGNVSSAEQWAMGRVNAFMAGLRGKFPRKPFDLDLFPKGHPRSTKKSVLDNFFDTL